MNIYAEGDFISQYTDYWCVAAAMQTMINIIDKDGADTSRQTQRNLYFQGRELSTPQLESIGIEPEGWANGLNARGYGPYVVHIQKNRKAAVQVAGEALRLTGRPVGLVTWRGAHSWVMSGFTSTADPAYTADFEVDALYVQDVWYPRVSSIWGVSPEPNTLWPVERLPEDYRPFLRPNRVYPDRDGQFVLILPVTEAPAG